jgi:ribosomal protein S18 acetylase RimI-like enzyme
MPSLIRKATVDDAPGIAHVHVESWRSTYKELLEAEFLASLSIERRAEAWKNTLADPQNNGFVYVAENEAGHITGFASAGPGQPAEPDYAGEVYAIYLLKEAQGQGLGRRLMQAAMQELTRRGMDSMLLWVLKDNLPSRRFYEALGGTYLKEKPITIGNQTLIEVAYAWKDMSILSGGKTPLES